MRADVVFIGGGLAALVSGIKLLKTGKNVIIISAGQSALHFSSGSFSLLNRYDNKMVLKPLDYISQLDGDHPYKKIGNDVYLRNLLSQAKEILEESGIKLKGDYSRNHFRMTPFGQFVPSWLTIEDHLTLSNLDNIPFKKSAVIGIEGFLDFYPDFISQGLNKLGIDVIKSNVNIEEFNILRNNPTEMRAPNIARALTEDGIKQYAQAINRKIYDCDIAVIPAVVGLNDNEAVMLLNELVDCPVYSVSTIPVAVPGIRMKILLQQYFSQLGGWYLLGDSVTNGVIDKNHLVSVNTANLGNSSIQADHFVLSTGGLFSRGLKSDSSRVYEPIFGFDVEASENRGDWYDRNFFHSQPFMRFGVRTDSHFHCFLNGTIMDNVFAIGGILGGNFDPLYDGVGAGVTLVSALNVADQLI